MDNLTSALCRIVRSTELDACVLLSARHRYGAPQVKNNAFGRPATPSFKKEGMHDCTPVGQRCTY